MNREFEEENNLESIDRNVETIERKKPENVVKNAPNHHKKRKNPPSKIPYIFVGFFLFFIIVDLIFIYIAKTTWRGTVSENAYELGKEYNKFIDQKKQQDALGWKAISNYEVVGKQRISLTFDLKDKDNEVIDDAVIEVRFIRPTQEGKDFTIEMPYNNIIKKYQKEVSFPLKGLWRFELQAVVRDQKFNYIKRIVID